MLGEFATAAAIRPPAKNSTATTETRAGILILPIPGMKHRFLKVPVVEKVTRTLPLFMNVTLQKEFMYSGEHLWETRK
jgi:hypothetical protein